jgi:hypothetical protein
MSQINHTSRKSNIIPHPQCEASYGNVSSAYCGAPYLLSLSTITSLFASSFVSRSFASKVNRPTLQQHSFIEACVGTCWS